MTFCVKLESSPSMQLFHFFTWFQSIGIDTFDIQIKKTCPKNSLNSIWITCHKDVHCSYILLKLYSWINHENSKGSDIYIRPCETKPYPYFFLDDLSLNRSKLIADKYASCVVQTSYDNTQIWVATNRNLSKEERYQIQKNITLKKWGDPASISGNHLGRICGVRSYKRNCWVNLKYISRGDYFSVPKILVKGSLPLPSKIVKNIQEHEEGKCASKESASEKEFGWVLGMLRTKVTIPEIKIRLTKVSSLRGKKNVPQYVERTIQNAILLNAF
jgi:hypothetical protein